MDYTKRINGLRMPLGYQPPKFQQFEGKGNPKQHVAHFIETCNNAGKEGDHLVKQFIRSLKGNAFEWYTDLEPESIDSWDQMECEFLNRFYSTRRTVGMMELTNTKQWRDEPAIDFINRWCSLSLDCIKPRSFEELATRAHDMELSIASHKGKKEFVNDQRQDKAFSSKVDKGMKRPTKESMTVNVAPIKISLRDKREVKKAEPSQTYERKKRPLTEWEQKTYPFPDSDVAGMLEDLLENKVIELPECKRPEEMHRVNDPKYCKFHRLISHPFPSLISLKAETFTRIIMDETRNGYDARPRGASYRHPKMT
ncbi:hypothetical protein ACLB2K_052638 [Fragaria x ananassa]